MSAITDIRNRNLLFRYWRRIWRTENRHSDMEVFRYWHQSSIRYPTLKKKIIPPIGFEPGLLAMVSECYNTKLKCVSTKMWMSDIGYRIKLYSNIHIMSDSALSVRFLGFLGDTGASNSVFPFHSSNLPSDPCHTGPGGQLGGQKTMTSSFNNTIFTLLWTLLAVSWLKPVPCGNSQQPCPILKATVEWRFHLSSQYTTPFPSVASGLQGCAKSVLASYSQTLIWWNNNFAQMASQSRPDPVTEPSHAHRSPVCIWGHGVQVIERHSGSLGAPCSTSPRRQRQLLVAM